MAKVGFVSQEFNEEVPVDDRAEEVVFAELPPVTGGSQIAAEWALAWANLRSNRSEFNLSLSTFFALLAVTLAVASMNWVIAVMTGFEFDLRDKILGANAHIVVFRYSGALVDYDDLTDQIVAHEGVIAASPFVYGEMMIRSSFAHTGVVMKGIDTERTREVTHLWGDLVEGFEGEILTETQRDMVFADLAEGALTAKELDGHQEEGSASDPSLPGIVIGTELAKILKVKPGDKVQIINPIGGGVGPMGMPTPSIGALRVAAIFSSGMYEYDNKWTYVTNDWSQDFLGIGESVNGIEVKVEDIDNVEVIAADIDRQLGFPHYSRHWKDLNSKLFAALEQEKWVVGILYTIVIFISSLLIINTLSMLVMMKGREIAIVKAMGASKWAILRSFLMTGAVIGVVGTVLGTIFGLVGCELLRRYEYPLETDVYFLDTVPVVVDPATVAVIAAVAFLIAFVCTGLPAFSAAKLDPVEGLRYE